MTMRKRKWLRSMALLALLLVIASVGFSRALRSDAAHRFLIAHLVASFGRPVEVAHFNFSVLDGARLEADEVTVAEDPHFGNEYFLRAETLTAGLRWSALLAGRFEFGSLSLLRPSLNLVRDADGHWNIERWLPPVPSGGSRAGFVGPLDAQRPVRLYRIQVDGGRINFKYLDDKSPLALLGVAGSIEQDGTGRWQLDLEARPMRAGVGLQDIGTLRLRGTIAGTSARLQPAQLNLTWRDASLADALRLARQEDYGMRGDLSMDLDAKIGPPDSLVGRGRDSSAARWSISAVARLSKIHGWRMPNRETDPAANVSVEAAWQLGQAHAEVRKLLIEMANSRLQGAGDLDWGQGFDPEFHLESSSLGLSDVLSWYRALHPDVAENVSAQGALGVNVKIGGWPLQLKRGAIAGPGGALTGTALPSPLQVGAVNANVSKGGLEFGPTEFSFSPKLSGRADNAADESPEAFLLRGSIFPDSDGVLRWPFNWNLSVEGTTSSAQDWLILSDSLAQPIHRGWTAVGSVAVKMRGARASGISSSNWLGTVDFRGVTLRSERLNQPVRLLRTHVEFSPAQRTITISAGEALGTAWHGSISRKNSDTQWTFDLSGDRLDTADLDRWLGPRARPGFLARLAGIGTTSVSGLEPETGIVQLAAHGRLRVGEIVMTPIRLDNFDGQTDLAGRIVNIRSAQADFYGGKVFGTLNAQLLADPVYEFQSTFDHVDLSNLARDIVFLNDRIAGKASATLSVTAHGIGRANLIASLEGNGTLNAKNVELADIDFRGIFPGNEQNSPFASVQGAFHIQAAGIELSDFSLEHSSGRIGVDGQIAFSRALNIRLHPSILQADTSLSSVSPPMFVLSGTIEDPKLAVASASQASGRTNSRPK